MTNEESDNALMDLLDRLSIFSKFRILDEVTQSQSSIITAETINNIKTLITYVTLNPTEGIFRISSKSTDVTNFLDNLLEGEGKKWDVFLAANALKTLWRESAIIPPRYYYPLLRLLHIKSTIKRVELIQKILHFSDNTRRVLLHQVILVAKGLVEDGNSKLDVHGMAVLLAPCVFSQRPDFINLDGFPLDINEPDNYDPSITDSNNDVLALNEADWMIDLFTFMVKHEQRIFTRS